MSLWDKLSEFIVAKGYSLDILERMKDFIDAPDDTLELPRIFENLLQLLFHSENIVKLYPQHLTLIYHPEWSAVCKEMLSFLNQNNEAKPTRREKRVPLWGFYETNPVFVAIWESPQFKTDRDRYYSLLAHCSLAVANLRRRMAECRSHENSYDDLVRFGSCIKNSLLSVRKLAHNENSIILQSLPDDLNVRPQSLLEILQNSHEFYEPIALLFKYLLELKKPLNRKGDEEHRQGNNDLNAKLRLPAQYVEMQTNLDPDQVACVSSFDLLQLPTLGENDALSVETIGCSSGESFSGTEIAVPNIAHAQINISSNMQKAVYVNHAKAHLAMQNQRLGCRWEMLSLYEISQFLQAVSDLLLRQNKSQYLPPNTDPIELAALLTTLFWFGQRLDRAVKLVCYHGARGKNATDPGFVYDDYKKDGYWWVAPAVPLRKVLPDQQQKIQAYEIVNNFPIASGIRIERILSQYVRDFHRRRSKRLFSRAPSVYQKMVDDFLGSVNKKYSLRLTANRVSDYIFEMVSKKDGSDLTAAMYITGRENFLGRILAYYTALQVSALQSMYMAVCREIRDRHFAEHPRNASSRASNLTILEILPKNNSYIGSPYRPKPETIRGLVNHLQQKLVMATNAGAVSIYKLLRIHNSMTRYTIFMLGYGTGFRAIRDPFLSGAEIDWETGFSVFADKDNEDCYNSRLIWIPPSCLQQLKLSRDHVCNVSYRIYTLIPDLDERLDRNPRRTHRMRTFFVKNGQTSREYDAMTTGPALLIARLRSVCSLPQNANRHYLRSNLIEMGCPIEVVNSFMGHWERGEEPWGRFSGLSPLDYRDILASYLVPLLERDGWRPVPGLGAKL